MDFSLISSQAIFFVEQNPVLVGAVLGVLFLGLLASVVLSSSDGGSRKGASKRTKKQLERMRQNTGHSKK